MTHSQYTELLRRARQQIIEDVKRGQFTYIDTLLNSTPNYALTHYIDELALTDILENY